MRSRLAGIIAAWSTLFAPQFATAQTPVHSTFGPGDTYGATAYALCSGPPSCPAQWIAAQFTYTGPANMQLSTVRIAAAGTGEATVSFLTGPDLSTATLLESWILTDWNFAPPPIFSFASLTASLLVPNDVYWLRIMNGPSATLGGQWEVSTVANGVWASDNLGVGWSSFPAEPAPAYDVSAVTVAPEPASLGLLATGLLGLGVLSLIRRRQPG